MIIIGHRIIGCDTFTHINSIDEISSTASNSTVVLNYDLNIMDYCFRNNIKYAVKISKISESVFANNLNAKYIIIEQSISKEIQNIAENYMFDSKIIVIINNDDEIDNVANQGIDGVIYKVFLEGSKK